MINEQFYKENNNDASGT